MELSVSVPFPSTREAEIVLKTLQVDPEPKRSQLVRTMRVEGSDLLVTFACSEPATLRWGHLPIFILVIYESIHLNSFQFYMKSLF